MMKKLTRILLLWFTICLLSAAILPQPVLATGKQQKISWLKRQIKTTNKKIKLKNRQIKHWHQKLKTLAAASATTANQQTVTATTQQLAELNYSGQNEITVNHNNPEFSTSDLSTAKGAWQTYGQLDSLNRVTAANALLNQSLMPTAKRTELTWDPTGWHNKKIKSGWLYNRSHLIGYQLTGQNNNPRNLLTGTRELNAPEMLAHEDDIAYYLKQNPHGYVRYRVTPIFRGNELLARGVQMEAQSIDSNEIHFNVYIFNVQSGVTLNYADGTSQIN
nr:DNA/RNA non-specific endonuclease [Liquorilactobacillus sicerae]